MPPTPLDSAYCDALLFTHWSVRQKLNHVSSVQLCRSVRVLKLFWQKLVPSRHITQPSIAALYTITHSAARCN